LNWSWKRGTRAMEGKEDVRARARADDFMMHDLGRQKLKRTRRIDHSFTCFVFDDVRGMRVSHSQDTQ
jgi:hypothetical protein